MKEGPDISRLAALIGDPARSNILTSLMDGRALTASELAGVAGVTLSTASGHLSKLTDGGLLAVRKQGRHKYFALADADVAAVLEALMGLASGQGLRRVRAGPRDDAMRLARVCYNHLAGGSGVKMYQSLLARGLIAEAAEDVTLTDAGRDFAIGFGIDLAGLETARAPLCRACLDWSERRNHLAGSLGRALLSKMEASNWLRRDADSRVIRFSTKGKAAFSAAFPL